MPASWINQSLTHSHTFGSGAGYGLLWWLGDSNDLDIFYGLGYAGQLLIVAPEANLIIVANHEFQLMGPAASQQTQAFFEQLLPPILGSIEQSK